MRVRKGIFGGSFNPVHLGHLIMAQDALEAFRLDRVIFMPCATPAHKAPGSLAGAEHRMEMLLSAVGADPRYDVSATELDRGGVSYTVDTMRYLRDLEPATEWFFIIGQDSLFELYTWRSIHELLGLCRFITLARPGFRDRPLTSSELGLPDPWPACLAEGLVDCHSIGISSTEVRSRVANGQSITYLVPDEVEGYIRRNNLYLKTGEAPSKPPN